MEIAIIAVTYNRVASLNRLLDSLNHAIYPNNKGITLIISVDKSDTDKAERFADEYKWLHGDKIVDKHEQNLGLRSHMLSLGKWFDCFDALVVLEDDIIVSPNYYRYTELAVEKYFRCEQIVGISLYGFCVNYQTGHPFTPIKKEHDAYFMNCAMSWGEVWMRDSWNSFYEWYLSHQEFNPTLDLPHAICSWGKKSWLKYHTRYCIEENKYFVFPYVSLSSNFGDKGEHNDGESSTVFQVEIQQGVKNHFDLPDFDDKAVYYDGFFENKSLYEVLGYSVEDLCIDLQGESKNRTKKRYWLTCELDDYMIVRSFGLNYRPIESNILHNNQGEGLYLYDTNIVAKNKSSRRANVLLYNYHMGSILYFMKEYGISHICFDFLNVILKKIKNAIVRKETHR